MTQGERVRYVRKELKMTLEQFGKGVGVGKTAISKLEKETCTVTEQMARAICREYNVNYDYLMYGEGEPFEPSPKIMDELAKQYYLTGIDRILIESYMELPLEYRLRFNEKIQNLIKKEVIISDER